jgi:sRNA-binding carbon storage regulator CsrA
MDEATSADAMLAQKMAQVYNEVSKMNDVMVVSTARSRGMDVKTPDISILRKELVANIAKESFKQEQRNTHSKLMESSKVVTKNLDDIATRGVGAADVY